MSIITDIINGSASGILDGVSKVVSGFIADPTQKAAMNNELQTLILKNQADMAALAEQKYEAQLKDTQSARDREVSIANSKDAPTINKIALPILALFITLGFFGLLSYLLKYEVPKSNEPILFTMLGSLGTAWIGVVSYYFGSSKGSSDKDETIAKIAQQS